MLVARSFVWDAHITVIVIRTVINLVLAKRVFAFLMGSEEVTPEILGISETVGMSVTPEGTL